MKIKQIYSLATFFATNIGVYAKVGINLPNPQASLDVASNGTSTTIRDGIMAPRISRQQLAAKNAGTYLFLLIFYLK